MLRVAWCLALFSPSLRYWMRFGTCFVTCALWVGGCLTLVNFLKCKPQLKTNETRSWDCFVMCAWRVAGCLTVSFPVQATADDRWDCFVMCAWWVAGCLTVSFPVQATAEDTKAGSGTAGGGWPSGVLHLLHASCGGWSRHCRYAAQVSRWGK